MVTKKTVSCNNSIPGENDLRYGGNNHTTENRKIIIHKHN